MPQTKANAVPIASPSCLTCEVCDRRLRDCWRFRDDDRFCPLCGEEVLHLLVGQPSGSLPHPTEAPDHDRNVWIYWHPGQDPHLHVTWVRGLNGRHLRCLHPGLDLTHSHAYFRTDRAGELDFHFEEVKGTVPEVAILRMILHGRDRKSVRMASVGSQGRISLQCDAHTVIRNATLIICPDPPLAIKPLDPSVKSDNGTLQIYQRHRAVPIRMHLTTRVPIWLLGCRSGTPEVSARDFTIRGFEQPICVSPGQSHPFEVIVNSVDWHAGNSVPFHFIWDTIGLDLPPFVGKVAFIEGSRLDFGDVNPQRLTVQLGQVFTTGFPLSVRDGKGGPDDTIRIIDYEIDVEPSEGDWLRVIDPSHERLPLDVPPNNHRQLILQIDTTRLDRARFNGAWLRGRIELIDLRMRRWRCEVDVEVKRADPLLYPVAFDWGTTNSCAAYRTGSEPDSLRALPLDEQQKRNPENFPSDIYFEDLSDPAHPVIHIGHEATSRTDHPECCLRSVKRKFPLDRPVFVMDEQGRRHTYPVKQVVKLLVRRLIDQAEKIARREIGSFGFTFPTKWPPSARGKLQEVAKELREELQRERQAMPEIVVRPPEIDEANAVAIHILTTREGLPERFYLAAYDFGGGTIDTSVLEVRVSEAEGLQTRYIGIGGRSDFGGDEVTRAVMMLMRQRLMLAFEGRRLKDSTGRTARLLEVLLVCDGDPLDSTHRDAARRHQLGRRNWDTFWDMAVQIKFNLCASSKATNLVSSELRRLKANIWCRIALQGEQRAGVHSPQEEFRTLEAVLDMLEDQGVELLRVKDLNFTLTDVYDYRLDDVDYTSGGLSFSVRERVRDTIQEMQAQCQEAGVQPDLIVLAGAGCRLPLVEELMRETFPLKSPDALIFDPKFSKQRVAHGLASYLYLQDHSDFGGGLSRSVAVIHYPLGLLQTVTQGGINMQFIPIVRPGSSIDDASIWHPFSFIRSQICTDRLAVPAGERPTGVASLGEPASGPRRLMVSVQRWRDGKRQQLFGYFDLARPVEALPGDEACIAEPLPLVDGGSYACELRLRGATRMEIRVSIQGRKYGPFPLVARKTDPRRTDLENLLQG